LDSGTEQPLARFRQQHIAAYDGGIVLFGKEAMTISDIRHVLLQYQLFIGRYFSALSTYLNIVQAQTRLPQSPHAVHPCKRQVMAVAWCDLSLAEHGASQLHT